MTALALAAIGAGLWWARPALLTAVDQTQPRLDQAAPPVSGAAGERAAWRQTFTAQRNGLSAVEVLAVVHADAPAERSLSLRLLGPDGAVIAQTTHRGVAHNAPLRLDFPPLPASAGRTYTLEIAGQAASVWAFSLDGYARGELRAGDQAPAGDLRFSTTYTYLPADMSRDAMRALGQLAARALPAWLILFAPGLLMLDLAGRAWPLAACERWGLALALSLALAPLLWQWATTLGLAWGPVSLSAGYALAGLAWLARQVWRWRRAGSAAPAAAGDRWLDAALALTLVVGLLARFLAIRDLALPSWVDSPHHLAIARLLAETGQVAAGYQPVLPVDTFTYHFGFHALAVAFHWLSGLTLPETFLWLGQLLNGLAPLATEALVLALGGRRPAAWGAVFIVGLVSLFPAYYVSWGRYTQLTGLLILAPLAGLTWRLVQPAEAAPGARRATVSLALLAAGLAAALVMTHYRILFFYVTFVIAAWVVNGGRGWAWLLAVAGFALGLAAPWLARLIQHWILPALSSPSTLASVSGYNDFPVDYFRSPLERAWLAAALLALVAGLARRDRAAWALGLWTALTFGLLNFGPALWLVNNNAWAISLFLPAAALLGLGLEAAWEGAGRLMAQPAPARAWLGAMLRAGLAGALAWAGARGLFAQVAVANAATILATADDVAALEWVAASTPPDAVFLTNSWNWQLHLWAAPDGGAWLWMLTRRRATMPPLDYTYQPDWEARVRAFNERLAALTAAQGFSVAAPEFQALLREAGVTHVYIGARGGALRPEQFTASPDFELLYSNGAAWVFRWRLGQGSGRTNSLFGSAWPWPSTMGARAPSAAR